MRLPILKELPYVSPSSFNQHQRCNYFTYLRKLAGYTYPQQMQSTNAALGTVFDAAIKSAFCTWKGWEIDRQKIWDNVSILNDQIDVIQEGLLLSNYYLKTAIKQRMLDHFIGVDFQAPEGCNHKGVPLFGYPDAVLEGNIPLDWKTTGYKSKYNVSPKPGYKGTWNIITGGQLKSEHKKCGEPLDHIIPNWATQGLFYAWMLGLEVNPQAAFHQITYQTKHIVLSIYSGGFSDEFIKQTESVLAKMWEECGGSHFTGPDPVPCDRICISWGKPCEASVYCEPWKRWKENV